MAAALAVFAALTFLVGPGDIRAPRLPPELSQQPNAYVEDGTITQYRADGSLHYRMHVRQATYFDQGGMAEAIAPAMDFYVLQGPPWRIESASGEMRDVTTPTGAIEERVDLAGDVVLSRAGDDGPEARLRTASLTLYPSRELIRGDQPVMIERGGGRTTAGGFEADLASGRIEFVSDTDRRVSIVIAPTDFQ